MRQWAIAIGINQYQFFQPLAYAQQDALALRSFLVKEAGCSAEDCLLLTETAPLAWGQRTTPDRTTILGWLDWLGQQMQPEDHLWFFFSGYGVCYQGQDYLAPIDGNPLDIPASALAITDIIHKLQHCSPANLLLLLDMNRSEGGLSPATVGIQTAEIVHRLGIPTILSCKPGQFSRETMALGQGFFTTALLEGLRQESFVTVADLDRYLSDRLPELSQTYGCSVQQPYTLCPPDRRQQPLLWLGATDPRAEPLPTIKRPWPDWRLVKPEWVGSTIDEVPGRSGLIGTAAAGRLGLESPSAAVLDSHPLEYLDLADRPADAAINLQTESPPSPDIWLDDQFAAGTLANSNGTTAPDQAMAGQPSELEPTTHPLLASLSPVDPLPDAAGPSDPLFGRRLLTWSGLITGFLLAGVLLRNWQFIQGDIVSVAQTPEARLSQPIPQLTGKEATGISGTSTSRQTPAPEASPSPIPGPAQANQLNAPVSLLAAARARTLVKTTQASPFWYAIQDARRIPANHPEYRLAPLAIAEWSQDILNIAHQRFTLKDYDNAILAAILVPPDQPIYMEARAVVTQSCPLVLQQPARNPIQQQRVDAICRLP